MEMGKGTAMGWIRRILIWLNIGVLLFGVFYIGGGALQKNDYEKNLKLGISYEKSKAYADAYRQYKRLAAIYPEDPNVLIRYADASYRSGKFFEMQEALVRLKKCKGDEVAVQLYTNLEKFILDEAAPSEGLRKLLPELESLSEKERLKKLEQFCNENRRDYLGFQTLGNAYMEAGEYLKAIDQYTEALVLKPEMIPTILNLATAYREIGYYTKAESIAAQALKYNPQSSQAYITLTRIKLETYEDAKAIEYAKKASMELDPMNSDAKAILAVTAHYAGMQNESLRLLSELKKESYFDYENLKNIIDGKLVFRR